MKKEKDVICWPAFVAIYPFKCFFWIWNVLSRFEKYEKGYQKYTAKIKKVLSKKCTCDIRSNGAVRWKSGNSC